MLGNTPGKYQQNTVFGFRGWDTGIRQIVGQQLIQPKTARHAQATDAENVATGQALA
jgi:hypothetical protein